MCKKKEKVAKKKNKIEFSKIMVMLILLALCTIAVWSMWEYYYLVKLAIMNNSIIPDATLPVTSVTTILGTITSYFVYKGYLKGSLNKNSLTIDENGIVKSITSGYAKDVIDKIIDNSTEA